MATRFTDESPRAAGPRRPVGGRTIRGPDVCGETACGAERACLAAAPCGEGAASCIPIDRAISTSWWTA